MRVSIPDWRREPPPESRAGVPELTLHLRLDVERLLPAPHAALVTGDHELAHLVPERVVRALWTGEGGQLRVDVERRLPTALTPRRFGLQQLADLRLGLRAPSRGVRVRATRAGIAVEREIPLADLLVELAGAHERDQGTDDAQDRHDDHHHFQAALHLPYSVAHVAPTTPPNDGAQPARGLSGPDRAADPLAGGDRRRDLPGRAPRDRLSRRRGG